ncbi:bifunctional riboflavin kinase/FAD synthetase [Rhodocytophaga aerolata]|uniref:Riboflavin biosynthesis protein n=1 Tax=Rhodocytophaga aerolata TaxID=455078 RepID=A0ABT8RFN0_9BACT|nr:bifunctional riboflavin kinase/FAD synthetase [Rhodocytophaga aerolata]MDO1450917.1 bifunctional riboflavin kinase/FAD synthetase [Rhodocytophaga aerolata]
MKVHQGLDHFTKLPFAVVTSGTFDGVHVGHQKILARLREVARLHQGETVVITYWPHPRLIVSTDSADLKLLSTIDEKIELLDKHQIDHLVIIPFTKEFSQLSSKEFITQILVEKIGTQKLVIGYDHRFGKNREGSFEHLIQNASTYGFEVEEIPRQDIDDVGVSSTRIRHALMEGNIHIANEYLGSPYTLSGRVVAGDQIGRQLGFPTANIHLEQAYKLVPMDGIYAVKVAHLDKLYQGMLYIGSRPTIDGKMRSIEVNIFDFNQTIYGDRLAIYFMELIRKDQKFDNMHALQVQLQKDYHQTVELFKTIIS